MRFEDFVKKEGTCWIWKGAFYPDNEPLYIARGKGRRARNVAFEKHCRPLPSRARLIPKCRDPRCIRPEHQTVTVEKS